MVEKSNIFSALPNTIHSVTHLKIKCKNESGIEQKENNISDRKSGATHVEDTDEDDKRVCCDTSQRWCRGAVNKITQSPQQN